MLQQWIAGIIVAFAALYALWYWLPAGLRRRLGGVQKSGVNKPGCGACSSCGGCGATAQSAKPTGPASDDSAARQVMWIQPAKR